MSVLRYFKHQIPIPEEAGIGSKETEAASKEVEKFQTVTRKMEGIIAIANNKHHIVDFAIKMQVINCILQIFLIFGILEKN